MNFTKSSFFICAILFQLLVLGGEYVNSIYPRYIGQKVILPLRPVDPRSMFRGQYARLNYSFSSFKEDEIEHEERLYSGQHVYVKLKKNKDGVWEPNGASVKPPRDDSIAIRGVAQVPSWNRYRRNDQPRTIRLIYGIEAYFASPDRALEIERGSRRFNANRRRQETIRYDRALVMIAPNGKASLVEVLAENEKNTQ